jgi:hypothetical protein
MKYYGKKWAEQPLNNTGNIKTIQIITEKYQKKLTVLSMT